MIKKLDPVSGLCGFDGFFVHYEEIKQELHRRLICECRCDDRLKPKVEGSTRLAYTGSHEKDMSYTVFVYYNGESKNL